MNINQGRKSGKNSYETQKQNPLPGDFSELVRNDLTEIGLNMSDRQISRLNK